MSDGSARVVVVGLGNRYRRDDGVGVIVAEALADLALPDVAVVTDVAEPMGLLDAWSGAEFVVLIDASVADSAGGESQPTPGRVRRCAIADLADAPAMLSSHRVDVAGAYALGQQLGRIPKALVLVTIEAADAGHGTGLTADVAAAVPAAVRRTRTEINRAMATEADT
ncbi:hydrogenase maturation protease [Mycobacterium spongiae]|uniref:Hydrogenase maturation protease n=1 Tax=Mycobacterium spongiae TaxID=886343 RepID=A0A975PX59_9MYCO|nr:hydrogenase maturation protease [Mycobacterium spongiae]QUR67870.1 hydrogenase maturation protease [Mycobacterium spongiae]